MTIETTYSADELEAARKLFSGSADFVLGCASLNQLPPGDRTEVAFAGRSNVGKSSLVNALLGRKALARSSAEPGKTRELNYFDISQGAFYLVDLPGYGYAKVSRTQSEAWMKLTRQYLRGRASLKRVFLLVDSRRGAMPPDLEMMDMLDQSAVNYQIILTKVDKLKKGEADKVLAKTEAVIKKRPAAHPFIRMTSSVKGVGLPELRADIAALV